MIPENPYVSPSETIAKPNPNVQSIKYKSRKQAIVAGIKKGAKFGGKIMAVISIIFAIIFWLFAIFGFLYVWLWKGINFGYLLEKVGTIEILKMIGGTPLFMLYFTFLGAFAGALIMGVAGGIKFRPLNENKDQALQENDFSSKGIEA